MGLFHFGHFLLLLPFWFHNRPSAPPTGMSASNYIHKSYSEFSRPKIGHLRICDCCHRSAAFAVGFHGGRITYLASSLLRCGLYLRFWHLSLRIAFFTPRNLHFRLWIGFEFGLFVVEPGFQSWMAHCSLSQSWFWSVCAHNCRRGSSRFFGNSILWRKCGQFHRNGWPHVSNYTFHSQHNHIWGNSRDFPDFHIWGTWVLILSRRHLISHFLRSHHFWQIP